MLAIFLHSGAPLGTTAAQYMRLAKSRKPPETVRSLGQAQVAGRTADVLQLSPVVWVGTGSCVGASDCASKEKGYGSATMWLDHQYGIVLRYEERGIPKRFGAERGQRYLVTSITFGSGPSDADLAYTPPVAIEDLPQSAMNSSGGGGGGPGARFQAPPGFIAVSSPTVGGAELPLRQYGSGSEWLSNAPSFVQGLFGGSAGQGFVYVKERVRAQGLPPALMTGQAQAAGSCQVWTGTFADGLRWLAMMRGQVAVLVVADKLTQADLVQYAATGICAAAVEPPPTATEVLNTALDRLETEIDITRQILGWTIVSAPSAADKKVLKGFDGRLEAFDRAVFAIRHRGDPHATYTPPGFPPAKKQPFKDVVGALKGEIPAARYQLAQAEAAVQSPADKQTLVQGGKLLDQLVQAVDGMVTA